MTAVEIVGTGKRYNRDELRKLISGHLCRCTGYVKIVEAIRLAARRMMEAKTGGKKEES